VITLTRRRARDLRAIFRRHPLGIAHKGPVPPLVFRADPAAGLRVRHHQAPLAVELVLPGPDRPGEAVALPLDALADFEGRDDTPVVLEAAAPDRTLARWEDRGIPRSKEYPVPDPAELPSFPGLPTAFETCPAGLLDALAQAAATTDEGSTRYALDCLQLKGDTGEVVATDGRQILIQGGYRFPWGGDLLVRRTPLFASRALPRDRPVAVGRTDAHAAVRAGDWTVWLTVRADARFPRTEHAVPDPAAVTTRLRLGGGDAAFLARALDRLPGGDDANAPVTLDLNGRVAVRARDTGQGPVTELVLSRSVYTGAPVVISSNRAFLARAVRLGFAGVDVVDADSPVVCRDGPRVYCFQPLSKESAIGPGGDVTLVESCASEPTPAGGPGESTKEESTMSERTEGAGHRPVDNDPGGGIDRGSDAAAPGQGTGNGVAALILEAEGLHTALGEAKARAARLTVALRRHRKRERLVDSTLASLRALKLEEVSG